MSEKSELRSYETPYDQEKGSKDFSKTLDKLKQIPGYEQKISSALEKPEVRIKITALLASFGKWVYFGWEWVIKGIGNVIHSSGEFIGNATAAWVHWGVDEFLKYTVPATESIRQWVDATAYALKETAKWITFYDPKVLSQAKEYWEQAGVNFGKLSPEEQAKKIGEFTGAIAIWFWSGKALSTLGKLETVGSFGSVEEKTLSSVVNNMSRAAREWLRETAPWTMSVVAQVKGNVKWILWNKQKGSVGDMNKKSPPVPTDPTVPKMWEIMRSFDPVINSPKNNLKAIESINKWLIPEELIRTKDGIGNFIQTLENISKYIEWNVDKIWPLQWDYVRAMQELRRNLGNIADHPNIAPMEKMMLNSIEENDLVNTIYKLNPQLWPKE